MDKEDKLKILKKIKGVIYERDRKKVKYKLTLKQLKILKNYLNFLEVKEYSNVSIHNNIIILRLFFSVIPKEVELIKKEDIENFIAQKIKDGVTPGTLNVYKQSVKEFFKWYHKIEGKGQYPHLVGWLEVKTFLPKEIRKEDLLNWQDIREVLLPNCDNFRDKALIVLLRETGARINEIFEANIGDVRLENDKGYIKVKNSKTRHGLKEFRELLLIDSYYYLDSWIRNHPLKSKDSPLFVGKNNKRIEYHDIIRIFLKLRKKIKISNPDWNKKLNPHHFRHSQASDMAKILSDAELRIFGGWTKGSPTIGRYTHITSEDVNEKRLALLGRVEKKDEVILKENLKPCPRCNSLIDYNKFEFCGKCGMALDREKEVRDNSKIQDLENKFDVLFTKFKKIEKEKLLQKIEKIKNDKQ